MPTENPFPLSIVTKSDSWEKLQLLANIDAEYKYTANEWNEIHQALNYLYENLGGDSPSLDQRLKKVIDIVDNTAVPPTEVSGDRYILDNTSSSHANWDGASAWDIVEFNGTTWIATTPEEGNVVYVDDQDKDAIYVDDGTGAWELRPSANNTYQVNILDFITDATTKAKVLTNDESQDPAIVKAAFDAAFTYCKTNGIKCLFVPAYTYVLDKCTINNLSYFRVLANGATFKPGTGDAIFELTQCFDWGLTGFIADSDAVSYADVAYFRVSTDSGLVNFFNCTFKNMPRCGIRANSLAGGTFTYGIQVNLCNFLDTPNFGNLNQCGIELAGDGEYSKIHHNIFQGIPSAIRGVDGANSEFSGNTCMQMNGTAYTTSYLNGIIYFENGSNSGKVDILYNKINHNDSGIAFIVCKGDPTKPQNPFKITGNDGLVNNSGTKNRAIYLKDASNSIIKNNKFRGNAASPNDTAVVIEDSYNVEYTSNYLRSYANGVQLINSTRCKIGGKLIFEDISTKKFIIDTDSLDVDCDTIAFSLSGYGVDVAIGATSPNWLTENVWLVNYQITAGVAPVDDTIDVGFEVNDVSKVSVDASIASGQHTNFSGTQPTLTQNELLKGNKVMFPITSVGDTTKGQDVKVHMKVIKL